MTGSRKKSAPSFREFSAKHIPEIDGYMRAFFRAKRESAPSPFMSKCYGEIEEYCLRKGKRVRPLLLMLAHEGYSRRVKGGREIVKLAAVLEIMHSFLLIQDDIIDRSDLRRGEKTLHVLSQERYAGYTTNSRIGSDVALILADVLFANAVEIIGEARIEPSIKNAFLKLFAETYEYTAWGQILDSLHSLPREIGDASVPHEIGRLKTAHYTIYYPLVMGLLLSGAHSGKEAARLRDFALPLGLAFQIRDDVLGVFGREDEIGKSAESDLVEGKLTHLVVDTVATMDAAAKKQFLRRFGRENKSKRDIAYIRRAIEASGCLEQSQRRLNELVETSKRRLEGLGMHESGKKMLLEFIGLIEAV